MVVRVVNPGAFRVLNVGAFSLEAVLLLLLRLKFFNFCNHPQTLLFLFGLPPWFRDAAAAAAALYPGGGWREAAERASTRVVARGRCGVGKCIAGSVVMSRVGVAGC